MAFDPAESLETPSAEELIWSMSPPERTFVDPFVERGGVNWAAGDEYQKGMGSGAGTDLVTDPQGVVVGTPGEINLNPNILSRFKDYAKKLATGKGSTADYATTVAGIAMLAELMRGRGKGSPAWQGKVTKGASPARAISPNYFSAVRARPYGAAAMGMNPFTAAEGGLAGLAKGGRALPPRYLRGETDGMADKIPSSIDGQQPAKLSHGEFVIPADVVSHLGNGNSDAGAKQLYKMMDRVRRARTGTKKQGKQINPDKFTPGGIASYAGGGAVAFSEGGDTTVTQGLAPWAGDYIAGPEGFLSKAWALGDKPYEAYQGPLTAGTSPLQQQAFTNAQNLGVPSQFGTATQFATQVGQGLGPLGSVQSYMNPYMQGVVDIQAREARRQADITQQGQQAKLAQAGAFGGSRDAIMRAEGARNLNQQIGDIQEKGLQSAYDRAMQQRAQEAGLGLQTAQTLGGLGTQQFGTQLQGLDALMRAGGVQQQAEQAAIDAQMKQFQEAQRYPYAQLQFQREMMQGLPVATRSDTTQSSFLSDLAGGAGGLAELNRLIKQMFPGG